MAKEKQQHSIDRIVRAVMEFPERLGDQLREDQVQEIVQRVFRVIPTLALEGDLQIRNFATFSAVRRDARDARNPRSGAPCRVAPRTKLKVRLSKRLKVLDGR